MSLLHKTFTVLICYLFCPWKFRILYQNCWFNASFYSTWDTKLWVAVLCSLLPFLGQKLPLLQHCIYVPSHVLSVFLFFCSYIFKTNEFLLWQVFLINNHYIWHNFYVWKTFRLEKCFHLSWKITRYECTMYIIDWSEKT